MNFFGRNWKPPFIELKGLGEDKGTSGVNFRVSKPVDWVLRFCGDVKGIPNNNMYAVAQVATIQWLHDKGFRYDVPYVQPANRGKFKGDHVLVAYGPDRDIPVYLNKMIEGKELKNKDVESQPALASKLGEMMAKCHSVLSGACTSGEALVTFGGKPRRCKEVLTIEATGTEPFKPETVTEFKKASKTLENDKNKLWLHKIDASYLRIFIHMCEKLEQQNAQNANDYKNLTRDMIPNHNDWQPSNLKWDGANRLTGLLDFGTLCVGPRVIDIANAIKFWWGVCTEGHDDKWRDWILREYAKGYRGANTQRPISEQEANLVPYLIQDNIAQKVWYSVDRILTLNPQNVDKTTIEQDKRIIKTEAGVADLLESQPDFSVLVG